MVLWCEGHMKERTLTWSVEQFKVREHVLSTTLMHAVMYSNNMKIFINKIH